jgi:hypothetical protein
LLATGIVSLAPLLLESAPVRFVPPHPGLLAWASKAFAVAVMAALVAIRALLDRRRERWAGALVLTMALLAVALTACHWYFVELGNMAPYRLPDGRIVLQSRAIDWQQRQYLAILSGDFVDSRGEGAIPHVFRPLPYGFVRALERLTGDWTFSCLAYRAFFTFWFLWASFQFVRLFHDPGRALWILVIIALLYPLSVYYYLGQLIDPLSHTLFALAFIWVVEDRWLVLALTLALGVLAKETIAIVVPAYGAAYSRQGLSTWRRTAVLAGACALAYLAVRLPLGWTPGHEAINGLEGFMMWANLGIARRTAESAVPVYQNYIHVALFVAVFLPFVVWNWRRLDPRLRALVAVVTPLLLASSLLFGWLYESRNYVPLLPLLTAAAIPPNQLLPGRGQAAS